MLLTFEASKAATVFKIQFFTSPILFQDEVTEVLTKIQIKFNELARKYF